MPTYTDIREYIAARRFKTLVRMLKGDGLTDAQIPRVMESFNFMFEGYKEDICEGLECLECSEPSLVDNPYAQDVASTTEGLLMFNDLLDPESEHPHKEELLWDALNPEMGHLDNLRHVSRSTPAHVRVPEQPFGAGVWDLPENLEFTAQAGTYGYDPCYEEVEA